MMLKVPAEEADTVKKQETELTLTNRAMRLEVSQGQQTWYHSIS